MTNLILQPSGSTAALSHYNQTIKNPLSLSDPAINKLLTQGERAELTPLSPKDEFRLWGSKPGEDGRAIKKWERIAPGDYVMFSFGKGNVSIAQVISKLRNPPLAKYLWGTTVTQNGVQQTWELMYAITQPLNKSIDASDFNLAIGRKPNANIQEFNVLPPQASDGGLNFLRLSHVPASPQLTEDAFGPITKRIAPGDTTKIRELDELDAQVRTTRRLEQKALREYVMPDATEICYLCNRRFPIAFLVAAHIKPRARCTDTEKRDIASIVMPNCKLGCDELFGRGFITVNPHDDGKIAISHQAPEEGPVAAYINTYLRGQTCHRWQENPGSHKYFSYHYNHEFLG